MASARDTRFDMMDITSPCYQLLDKTLDVMRDSLALASEDAGAYTVHRPASRPNASAVSGALRVVL
jgi:hypothetical protein